MPLFAGLDVHKEEIEAALINETGAVVLRHRFACERSAIESFAQKHLTKACVALEATTHCWAVAALLEPFCQEVVVSNPLKTRAIAEAKVKTDKVDAEVLAHKRTGRLVPVVRVQDCCAATFCRASGRPTNPPGNSVPARPSAPISLPTARARKTASTRSFTSASFTVLVTTSSPNAGAPGSTHSNSNPRAHSRCSAISSSSTSSKPTSPPSISALPLIRIRTRK